MKTTTKASKKAPAATKPKTATSRPRAPKKTKVGRTVSVQDIMTKRVYSCCPDTNVATAVGIMFDHDCGILPVVNAEGQAVGVVTDRDLATAMATQHRLAADITVHEVLSVKLWYCSPDDDISDALTTMATHKIRRLPVIGPDGRLEGILSITDAILHAGSGGDVPLEVVITALRAICSARRPVEKLTPL